MLGLEVRVAHPVPVVAGVVQLGRDLLSGEDERRPGGPEPGWPLRVLLCTTTAVQTNDGPTFGQPAGRLAPTAMRLGMRFRFRIGRVGSGTDAIVHFSMSGSPAGRPHSMSEPKGALRLRGLPSEGPPYLRTPSGPETKGLRTMLRRAIILSCLLGLASCMGIVETTSDYTSPGSPGAGRPGGAGQATAGGDLQSRLGKLDDFNKINSAMIDMEVAALACGTTKIVTHRLDSFGPSMASDTNDREWHSMAHECHLKSFTKTKWHVARFAEFVKRLDAVLDVDGNTLLDNTLVLYGSTDNTGGHFMMDLPVLLAGGKGKMQTDLYIDYRDMRTPFKNVNTFSSASGNPQNAYFGRPYNNLLITILKAFGMTKEDYTKYPDQDGFGVYAPFGYDHRGVGGYYFKHTNSSGGRHAPLPGLFIG